MMDLEKTWCDRSGKALWAAAAYLCICGLSAIAIPQSWLAVAGLSGEMTNEARLAFGVAGTFMLALGCGGVLAAVNPRAHVGLIVTMALANVIDFILTLISTCTGRIPFSRGLLFLAIALAWSFALILLSFRYSQGEEANGSI